jgi:hypothetical protein
MDFNGSLPAAPDEVLRNLEAALTTIGSGGSGGADLPGLKFEDRSADERRHMGT